MINLIGQARKERIKKLYKEHFKKNNIIIGTVIGGNSKGCYVRDSQSDEVVFYFGNGMKGDKVQLAVEKVDVERESVTCVLETVLEYGEFVA